MEELSTPGLSFTVVVQAVNAIKDYLEGIGIEFKTVGSGMFHVQRPTPKGYLDLLVTAVDTRSVVGFSAGKKFQLAKELGASAVIRIELTSLCPPLSVHEYLLMRPGDDPVRLFLQALHVLLGNDRMISFPTLAVVKA